jgi:hypothetical protein
MKNGNGIIEYSVIFSIQHHHALIAKKLTVNSLMKENLFRVSRKKVLTAPFLPQLLWFVVYDFVFWS